MESKPKLLSMNGEGKSLCRHEWSARAHRDSKEQLTICLWHMGGGPNGYNHQPRPRYSKVKGKFIVERWQSMKDQFEAMRDQIEALTTRLSNMGGHNGSGSRNPFAERWTHERQHLVQAHANWCVNRVKPDILEFQGRLQTEEFLVTKKIKIKINKKKVPRKAVEIRSQLVVVEENGFIYWRRLLGRLGLSTNLWHLSRWRGEFYTLSAWWNPYNRSLWFGSRFPWSGCYLVKNF